MSRICKKCEKLVPRFIWIDGKKRNCQHRKYCFNCSPFGEHNTSKLEVIKGTKKQCPDCDKDHKQKGNRCFVCYFNLRKQKRLDEISNLLGGFYCWHCGYNTCKPNIHFHHLKDKLFGLTTRELMLKWDKIWNEIKKCVLLCGNCHGEVHSKLISEEIILKMWIDKWNVLNQIHSKEIGKKELDLSVSEIKKYEISKTVDNVCVKCGKIFNSKSKKIYCSKQCRNKVQNKPNKEELTKLLWEKPTTHIAKFYNVSDNSIAKWAKKYNIEKPPRGYWTKRATV